MENYTFRKIQVSELQIGDTFSFSPDDKTVYIVTASGVNQFCITNTVSGSYDSLRYSSDLEVYLIEQKY